MTPRSTTVQSVTDALVYSFCHEIVEVDGVLLLSTEQVLNGRGRLVDDDLVGIESTMNKRYVADLSRLDENARETLMTVGRAIMLVWSERIALRFPGRDVLFYLGGSESVILRFHVRRPHLTDWTDLSDREYLTASMLEVYLLHDGNLTPA